MSEKETTVEAISTSFSAELASILFDTPANPDRESQEIQVVAKFEAWIRRAERKRIWAMALYIDETVVPLLSGKNLLHVAKLLEDRAPTVIDSMTNLKKHKDHLQRSAELAEILSPRSLDKLIAAMKASKVVHEGSSNE